MDPPELTNFGSLIRHAVALEAGTSSFYEDVARQLGGGESATLARQLAEEHDSRRRLLEKTRQQKLNEMVLEPITGLDGSRYVFDATLGPGPRGFREKAIGLETVGALLFLESASVASSLLTEAARTFQKLGEGNQRNLARVRDGFPA